MPETTLQCWVMNTPINKTFPVKIKRDNVWSTVKNEIKKLAELELNDIAAKTLKLWKVTLKRSEVQARLGSEEYLKSVTATEPLNPLEPVDSTSSTKLKSALDDDIDIIIVERPSAKRQRIDSLHDRDGNSKKRIKVSQSVSNAQLQSMKTLDEKINALSDKPIKYSAPNELFDLPFPSINEIPPGFASSKRTIPYMGRECFTQVWETLGIVTSNPDHRQAIYLYGCKGFGKSHILAALACLLIRTGAQVVYLPDCRQWLLNPVRYLRNAIVFAFINCEPSIHEEVLDCEDLESLANFCERYRDMGQLYFIVDQLNALDPELIAQDAIPNSDKHSLRRLVHVMSTGHILISSATANHKTFMYMEQGETGEEKISLRGGMTSSEMASWWKHHDFAAFSNADKQRVEDLTGCIPLLLEPFVVHHKESLESLEPGIWEDEVLRSVRQDTLKFAKTKMDQLDRFNFGNQFVDIIRKCLLGVQIAGSGSHIDHRYFYADSKLYGRYSCGLARQAITEFFRMNSEESVFLGPEWYDTLIAFKNNPSVTGFIVEQVVISKIASAGLRLHKFHIPGAKIVAFDTPTARLLMDRQHTYYVPVRFNSKAIDFLFASIDLQNKTAHLVPGQITIAKEHKDSEAAFFNDKDTWIRGLPEDFTVFISFLWIHHGERGRYQVEERLKKLKNRTIEINPNYESLWVSLEEIDVELANTLTKIPG